MHCQASQRIATVYSPSQLRRLLDDHGLVDWNLAVSGLCSRRQGASSDWVVDGGRNSVIESMNVIDAQGVDRVRRFLRLWHREIDPENCATTYQLGAACIAPWGRFLGNVLGGEVELACLLEGVRLKPIERGLRSFPSVLTLTDVPVTAVHTADPDYPTPPESVMRHELVGDYLRWLKGEAKMVGRRRVVRVEADDVRRMVEAQPN